MILEALKKYGMIVADNGSSWYITGAADPRWNDDDLNQLKTVPGSAFEVVDTGPDSPLGDNGRDEPAPRTCVHQVPGQESAWDYPRPPRLEAVAERLVVVLGGAVIADTTNGWRVLETSHPPNYYFPPSDVKDGAVEPRVGRVVLRVQGPRVVLHGSRRRSRRTRRGLGIRPAQPRVRTTHRASRVLRPPDGRLLRRRRARRPPGRRLLRRLDHVPRGGSVQGPARNAGLVIRVDHSRSPGTVGPWPRRSRSCSSRT